MITQKVLSNFLGYHSLVTLLKAYLNIVFDYPYYLLNSTCKCNRILINNLFKFFV